MADSPLETAMAKGGVLCRRTVLTRLLIPAVYAGFYLPRRAGADEARTKTELRKVTVQHAWVLDSALAGVFVAREKDYFAEVGLEVQLQPGGPGLDPVYPVIAGNAEVGIHVSASSAIIQRASDVPIRAFGSQYWRSPLGLLAKKSMGITGVEMLRGRRIGIVPASMPILQAVLKLNGLDENAVKIVTLSPANTLQPLLDDLIDVLVAFETNQGLSLEARGIAHTFLPFDDIGYRQEGYVLFAREATLKSDPGMFAAFIRAASHGWQDAIRDPSAAADLVVHSVGGLDTEVQRGLASKQIGFLRAKQSGRPDFYRMDPEVFANTVRVLLAAGLIKRSVTYDELVEAGPTLT